MAAVEVRVRKSDELRTIAGMPVHPEHILFPEVLSEQGPHAWLDRMETMLAEFDQRSDQLATLREEDTIEVLADALTAFESCRDNAGSAHGQPKTRPYDRFRHQVDPKAAVHQRERLRTLVARLGFVATASLLDMRPEDVVNTLTTGKGDADAWLKADEHLRGRKQVTGSTRIARELGIDVNVVKRACALFGVELVRDRSAAARAGWARV